MPLAVGLRSGPYENLAHIGEAGIGEAYFAKGDSLVPKKPRVWAEKPLGNSVRDLTFDVTPNRRPVVALFRSKKLSPKRVLS
jgi:hypothetical protein